MKDLISWGTNDLKNSEETAQNYTGEQVNDLKRTGITVTKVTCNLSYLIHDTPRHAS